MPNRSGTESRQRDYIFPVRLSPTERTLLLERIQLTGHSGAALVRHGLFQTPLPRPILKPTIEHAAIATMLGEFGKIGSNINQYARRRNMGRDADSLDHAMEAALLMLLELRQPCLAALGVMSLAYKPLELHDYLTLDTR